VTALLETRSEAAAPVTDRLIDVRGLTVSFGDRAPVVEDLDLHLDRGEILAIVGESGSGKSVTARSLVGLAGRDVRIAAQRFDILGTDVRRHTEAQWRALRGSRVGLVLQDALTSLDPLKTVGEEVGEALDAHASRKWSRAERSAEIERLLRSAGIPDPEFKARQYPFQLSGGQRQRALIASAIAAEPDIIVADEPTTALDVTIQAQILELLRQKVREGASLVLISHDLAVVAGLADRIVVLNKGRLVEEGPTREVIYAPREDYTKRLIAAIPGANSRGRRLSSLGRPAEPERAPVIVEDDVAVEAEGLVKWYRGANRKDFKAADDVSFSVRRREILGIVGESGSGKSTVAKLVTGLLRPDAGAIRVNGTEWPGRTGAARRAGIGTVQLVGQDSLSSFDPRFTVREIVRESVALVHRGRAEQEKAIRDLLDLVQLPEGTIERHPRELSGGQRQRVSIARALGSSPKLLVCDEPVSALDVSVQAQILDLLDDVRQATSAAFVFISHDIGVVHHLCDRVLVMFAGKIVEQGAAVDVFTRPADPYTRKLLNALPKL
jgi:peptide/nickel transport system ATP-binding protein